MGSDATHNVYTLYTLFSAKYKKLNNLPYQFTTFFVVIPPKQLINVLKLQIFKDSGQYSKR